MRIIDALGADLGLGVHDSKGKADAKDDRNQSKGELGLQRILYGFVQPFWMPRHAVSAVGWMVFPREPPSFI
jgi:hypothetical protein